MQRPRALGWYVTFAALVAVAFVLVDHFTGRDAVGATIRFVWTGVLVAAEALATCTRC